MSILTLAGLVSCCGRRRYVMVRRQCHNRGVPDPKPSDAEDLALLRQTVGGWLGGGPDLRQAAEMGFLGLLTPEAAGGSGWLPAEACVVAEEAGRALGPLAWIGNLVAASALSTSPAERDRLAGILGGTAEAALARWHESDLALTGDRVSGRVDVLGSSPTVLALILGRGEVAFIDCGDDGVELASVSGTDPGRPAWRVTLDSAPAVLVPGSNGELLEQTATILTCADSLGALSATSELIRTHLRERSAFQQPLAAFQVLQHRLADLAVLEAACRAMIRRVTATLHAGTDPARRRHGVAATHSYFTRNVPPALDDCIQLAGGIGFTFEFPVHVAMRRALANAYSVRTHAVSVEQIDPERISEPVEDDHRSAYRSRVRAVIEKGAPFEMREGHRAPESDEQETELRSWYRTLFDEKILGGSWPEEWGGDPDHQAVHELIVTEELIWARAPRPIDQVNLAAHVVLRFGTDEQKARYLPRIRSAQDIWCQLFSEPDCGSDLAGIKARAEQQSDGRWLLAGQKTWTTDGHWAQMGIALLRTSSEPRRHHGLTAFVVPMDTPGIEVRPKMTIGGAYEFNDVFLDGAVLGPEHVLGKVGEGWAVAMSGLEVERFGVGGNVLLLELLLADLSALTEAVTVGGRPLSTRSETRRDLAVLASDAFAARSFVSDHVDQALAGADLPADASIAKLLYTETYHRIARYGATLSAEYGPVPETAEKASRRLLDAWLWSRALTISGGSSEVMRNIIAKRRLGLP